MKPSTPARAAVVLIAVSFAFAAGLAARLAGDAVRSPTPAPDLVLPFPLFVTPLSAALGP